MAFVIADRVRETTTTTGTGAVTLAGAYISFQSFSAAIGNGNNTYYTIASPTTGEWEVGIGTYTSSTNSLSRDTVLSSSNSGSLVSFTAGSKDVFVTQPSERSLLINSASNGLVAGNAAFTANGIPYANATTTLTTGSGLTFDGTTLTANALSVTNGVTLSGGTANGVLYLNGSKVATSGSALTFDGTNFATTGSGTLKNLLLSSGTLPSAGNPSISLRSSDNVVYHQSGSANTIVMLDSAQNTMQNIGATTQIWNISNSEQMRLTSTGLGIGTSSPSVKLESAAANPANQLGGQIAVSSTTAYATGNVAGITFRANDSSAALSPYASIQMKTTGDNAGALTFVTRNGAGAWDERMRLSADGNLGLGTTTMTRNFNIGGAGAAVGMNLNNTGTSGRSYSIFSTNSGASVAGALAFYDDTAGSYRMVIDSSGNLRLINSNNIASITQTAITLTGAGGSGTGGQTVNIITSNSTTRGILIVGSTQNCSAIFFINASNAVNLSSQTTNETRFSATSGAANTANVYVSGSNIVLQNNIQATRDFYVTFIGQV